MRTYVRVGEATILHADLDAFYASVEQRDDPRLRGRPVIVGGGRRARGELRGARRFGVRTAMGGRAGPPAVPAGGRRPAADVGVRRGEQGGVRGLRATPRRSSRGCRSTRRSSTSAACERIAGTPVEIAARLRRDVRERVGLPITVGVARTKFLAKVASGVAKPDGLLVVPPDGELEFLHPLPVERLWGVGPVTAAQAARPRDRDRRRGRRAGRGGAGRRCSGAASGRHLHALAAQPRPAAGAAAAGGGGSIGSQRALGRAPAVARREIDAVARRPRRPRHAAHARGRPRRPHRRAAAALRRLLAGDAVAHAAARDRADAGRSSPRRAGCSPPRTPMIERRGLTLVGVAVGEPRRRRRASSSRCRSSRDRSEALDAALDEVRDRFGSTAVTRAVLLGRDPGFTVPLLPD